ncbi:MAG: hypothetical protein H8E35_02795 [Ardenticatenia bacterium]|nr:hypothetical protein [Ardenticatenia bacterium]
MGDNAPEQALEEVQDGSHDSVVDQVPVVPPSQDPLPSGPRVTFRGNSYDLISLGSLAIGGLMAFTCLTCNLGSYCVPFIAIALGLVGVLSAHQAVDAKRTRLWSWLGIAAGGLLLLLILVAVVLYVLGFIVLLIAGGELG